MALRGPGPMSPLDRLIIGAIGAATGAGGLALVAYSGPLLRWSVELLDRAAAWAH